MLRMLTFFALALVAVRSAEVKKDQDIEELLKNMKGMPGMEGIKMFTADDLKNMDPNNMGNMFRGSGGAGKKPPRKTRTQYKRQLLQFYERFGLTSKIAGVDAALDKWKGREERMFEALNKKYDDVIKAKLKEEAEIREEELAAEKAAEVAAKAAEEAANSAFSKSEL